MKKLFLPALFFLSLAGCFPELGEEPVPLTVEGLKPIYVSESQKQTVEALPPQPIVRLGKIYYKDETIYVNESNLGVHVIDNSDPLNPLKIKFLRIPGCRDIAIKGNILYADNIGDLIAVDISNLDQPKVVKRLEGIHGNVSQDYPELYQGYFECVDNARGVVVGWEKATLTDPKCWR